MDTIYLDSAATTSLDPEVLDTMMPYLTGKYGNPSAVYSYGRETKMAIESARKSVAKILNVSPGEIFFTSGGTESSNTAINAAVRDLGCTHIISSAIEHHATLYTVQEMERRGLVKRSIVNLKDDGHIDLQHLEELLSKYPEEKTLVTLMHANNEIGNLLDAKTVGALCEQHGALFHCDMVQTIGHYPIDLKEFKVHFASSSGHKFHGPKGAGVLYISNDITIKPMLYGGSQERNMRAGTENLYGIVGYAKALEKAVERYEQDRKYIQGLKDYMADQLQEHVNGVRFNGDCRGRCLYTVLNIAFPQSDKTDMLLMNLDMAGVCVSGGSACSSGASSVSHVIKALYGDEPDKLVPVRFSFCRHNTKEEIDYVISKLKEMV